jgi:hypothetical protein
LMVLRMVVRVGRVIWPSLLRELTKQVKEIGPKAGDLALRLCALTDEWSTMLDEPVRNETEKLVAPPTPHIVPYFCGTELSAAATLFECLEKNASRYEQALRARKQEKWDKVELHRRLCASTNAKKKHEEALAHRDEASSARREAVKAYQEAVCRVISAQRVRDAAVASYEEELKRQTAREAGRA